MTYSFGHYYPVVQSNFFRIKRAPPPLLFSFSVNMSPAHERTIIIFSAKTAESVTISVSGEGKAKLDFV